jgi:hypothetical protein
MSRSEYAVSAEQELAKAREARSDADRRAHFLCAARFLNLLHGGDPTPEGDLGYTY